MDSPALSKEFEDHRPTKRALLAAVNACATTARYGSIALSALVGFFFVSIASLTHKDLLLNTPVMLPFLQVQIPLLRFFVFAPIFLLVVHSLILVQHVILRGTIKALNQSLTDEARRDDPLRLEASSYFFVQVYAGPKRPAIITGFLFAACWLTLVLLPVLALLDFQVAFLPRHDWVVTWAHRSYLTLDLLLLFMMGTMILFPDEKLMSAPLHRLFYNPLLSLGVHSTILCALFFSFFVATLPDGAMEKFIGRRAPQWDLRDLRGRGSGEQFAQSAAFLTTVRETPVFWLTALLFEGKPSVISGKTTSWFARNLIVMNTDLVADEDTKERTGEVSLQLRGRDLRYARLDGSDLHRADLTGANLAHASLVRANISKAQLYKADMHNSNLNWADLHGTKLGEANLHDATLREANLEEADLSRSDMSKAMLSWAKMKGAKLNRADMRGAIVSWADMEGARLVWADLDDANLYGVKLRDSKRANWQLKRTVLTDADFGPVGATAAGTSRSQSQPKKHELSGVWSGTVKQPKFSGKSRTYFVELTITDSGNGFVDYPDLSCKGLDSGKKYGSTYIFEEKIHEGRDNCRDGHVKISVAGNEMTWEWFYDDGRPGASGTLKRQE